MLKITHAAGHALVTKGKESPDGYKEWQYTNEIVKFVIAELAHYENVAQKRIDDPSGKVDYSLKKRVQDVNDWGAHVHIDYHLNAFGNGGWNNVGGTETYVYTTRPKEALELARRVQANLLKELGFADRGVKAANFQMLRETKMTAILPEFAFMTNKNEAMKMRTAEYQKKAAKAVVAGLVSQYGLKRKAKPTPAPSASKKGLYKVQVGAFSNKKNADNLAAELKKKGYSTYIVQE